MAKSKYGYMKCPTPSCGNRLVVKKNEKGTLSASCDECDFSLYVQSGQAGYSKWDAVIEKPAAPPPAAKGPAPDDKKKDPPKPAPAPARAGLDL